ncbi:RNA-directed DNA polymerase, eukaryota, partial [Tanacetum coccineum]
MGRNNNVLLVEGRYAASTTGTNCEKMMTEFPWRGCFTLKRKSNGILSRFRNNKQNTKPEVYQFSFFAALNRALLLKWMSRFISSGDGSLWRKVIQYSIYGSKISSCDRIQPSILFPRLFALELDKEIVVVNKMRASSVSASFRRDVRDEAERQQWDDLSSIMSRLSSRLPKIGGLVICREMESSRLPTRVNLSRRGVLLDSHLCPLCNAAMEDVQHVFFRCDVARVVLRKICRWWDLDWQEICSFSDWDAWFLSFRLSSRLKSILEGVFYVAWWRIWRLRNQLVFDASPPNRSTIFDDI